MPTYELLIAAPDEDAGRALAAETGLRCSPAPPHLRLSGELVDRAALHGLVNRLQRLGIDLVELRRTPDRPSAATSP